MDTDFTVNDEDCVIDVVSIAEPNKDLQSPSSKPKLKCVDCDYYTRKSSKMHKHLLNNHFVLTSYKCRKCDHVALSKKLLNTHQIIKHKYSKRIPMIEYCDKCAFTAPTKKLIKSHHRLNHVRYQPWTCDVCKRTFRNEYDLIIHKLEHPEQEDFKFCCGICGFRAVTKSKIKTHTIDKHFNHFKPNKKWV